MQAMYIKMMSGNMLIIICLSYDQVIEHNCCMYIFMHLYKR